MKTAKPPTIDGDGTDEAWKTAPEVVVKVDKPARVLKPEQEVTLKVVHDGATVYALLRWKDKSANTEHGGWVWDGDKRQYVEGGEREDEAFLAFSLEGRFNVNMTLGVDAKWDVWQWQAARTNSTGHARDRVHIYTHEKPKDPALAEDSRNDAEDKEWWMLLLDDEGTPACKLLPAPKAKDKDRLPQFASQAPAGSAADVRAKGVWKDGVWTVEFARKLDTGRADDAKFEVDKEGLFAVGVLDRAKGAQHMVSLPHRLKLQK